MFYKVTDFQDSVIGKYPKDWDVVRLDDKFDTSSGGTPYRQKKEYYKGKIPWVKSGELKDKVIFDTEEKITEVGLKNSAAKTFPKGTVLVAMYGATVGKLGILNIDASTNQACCAIIPSEKIESKYLFYLLMSARQHLISQGYGGGQPNISQDIVKNVFVPVIDKKEQIKIATFLDHKTGKIDELIKKNEKLIELLKEKRQAIISQAVTKGLDPNAKTKDSGIEWIGEIPEGWGINKIKYASYVKGRIGWHGLRSDEFTEEGTYLVTGTDFVNGTVDWNTCYHVSEERYNEDPYIQLKENDLLITKDGTIGKVALVKKLQDKATLNSGIMLIRPETEDYRTDFMYWILNSKVFREYIEYTKTGSTVQHHYQKTFENFIFPVPNIFEQKNIRDYLTDKTSQIDKMIPKILSQISTLKEYRQALISNVVTGKVRVN